jgi:hypothetical protein
LVNYFQIWQGLERVLSQDFDTCIIGYCSETHQPVYSAKRMAKVLKKITDFDDYEAIDFVLNILSQSNSDNAPIICIDFDF